MKGISSIGHVAVRVKDIDRSLDFYVNKLGFTEMFRLHRDDKLWIVYLRVTDGQYIELFPDAVGDRSPPPEAIGLNHLCLTVDHIDPVLAEIDRQGIPRSGRRRCRSIATGRRGFRIRTAIASN